MQTATETVVTKHLPEIGYTIEARPAEVDDSGLPAIVYFVVTPKGGAAESWEASVRADGCANIHPDDCVHFCGVDDAIAYGNVLRTLYQMAADLMGDRIERPGDFGR